MKMIKLYYPMQQPQ